MKKLVKILSVFVKLGERAASLFGKVVDAADRLLHYKEYRRQKRVAGAGARDCDLSRRRRKLSGRDYC